MQEMPTGSLYHLFSDLQSGSHLIVDDLHRMFAENSNSFDLQSRQIKSLFSHIFGTCNLKYVFTILKSHTNSHYVMSQCDDLICLQNGRIRNFQDLHMLAEIFRANSRFRFTFFDSRRFFIQFQFADAVKDNSSSICLAVDSHRPFRELKTMKYSWEFLLWESVDLKKSQKLLFSNSGVLDRVNLFCLYFFPPVLSLI